MSTATQSSTVNKNFIGGAWVDGAAVTDDINPSNTRRCRRATCRRASAAAGRTRRSRPRRRPSPPGRAPARRTRHDILKRVGDEILARKDELGRLLSREEGKTLPEGDRRDRPRGADLPVLLRRGAAACRREGVLGAAGRRRRDHARADRRRRHDHALELPDRDPGLEDRAGPRLRQLRGDQAGRSGARDRRMRWPRSSAAPGRRPGVFNLVMGRGSVVGQAHARAHGRAAISFTGSVPTGRRVAAACIAVRPDEEGAARDGRQEPARRARRCRPEDRGRMRGQRRLLLHRPALHGLVAPDRHRRHPRPLRRGRDRAHAAASWSTMR